MKKLVLLTLALAALGCQLKSVPPGQSTSPLSILSGTIVDQVTQRPAAGVYVSAYRESNTHYFGPPNFSSAASGPDGKYRIELPAGNYQLFARKRQSGQYQGPLYKDDYFSEPQRTVSLSAGQEKRVDLSIQKLEGQQLYRPERMLNTTGTVISGRILDAGGKPVAGAFAFAYRDRFRKQAPPDYGSMGADASGKYILYLDEGGTFIVGARINVKEPPLAGEPLGFYHQDRATPVSIVTGSTLENIDITLAPFAGTPELKPGTRSPQQ